MSLNILPLPAFQPGSKMKVVRLAGCNGVRARLCALGLTPGTEVEIMSAGRGSSRVRVRECDLVLGRGMAEKVMGVAAEDYDPAMSGDDCQC